MVYYTTLYYTILYYTILYYTIILSGSTVRGWRSRGSRAAQDGSRANPRERPTHAGRTVPMYSSSNS